MEKEKISCPVCGGEARPFAAESRLLGGRVVLKDDRFYRCSKCGEEFSTAEQMREAEKSLREAFFFERKIISTGGSYAITLPPDLAKFFHVHKGGKVRIIPESAKTARIKFK